MNRPIRIVICHDPIDDHDVYTEDIWWGEQPPSYVPGEILIVDRSKVAEVLRQARRRGKIFIRRKSAIVAVDAAVIGVSSAIGTAARRLTTHNRGVRGQKSGRALLARS